MINRMKKIFIYLLLSLVVNLSNAEEVAYIDLSDLSPSEMDTNVTGIEVLDNFLDLDNSPDTILVGIANIEGGYNEVSGDSSDLSGSFKKGLWSNGRLSFFLKGVVRGEYLSTISYDSERGEEDVYDKIDPDKLYPVYGDASVMDSSGVDTSGKLYVLIEKGESSLKWGNFDVDISRTYLGKFRRNLYGANWIYSPEANKNGKTQGQIFYSEVKESNGKARFKLTGSDIYYMRNRDIVFGSLQAKLIVVDALNNIEIDSLVLVEGADYEVDYSLGKLSLLKDVIVKGTRKYIIGEGDLGLDNENTVYIDVSYQYEQTDFSDKNVQGYALHQSIGNSGFGVGLSGVKEDKLSGNYKANTYDVSFVKNGLDVVYEYGDSKSKLDEVYYSDNGGLSFVESDTSSSSKGDASYLKGSYLSVDGRALTRFYSKRVADGYSSSGVSGKDVEDYGVDIAYSIDTRSKLSVAYDILNDSSRRSKIGRLQYKYDDVRWGVVLEYKNEDKLTKSTQVSKLEDSFGVEGYYRFTDRIKGHIEYQTKGSISSYGLGVEGKLNEYFSVDASVIRNSKGTRGVFSLIGEGSYAINDKLSLKARAKVSTSGEVDYGLRSVHSNNKFEHNIDKNIRVSSEGDGGFEYSNGAFKDNSSTKLGVGADYELGQGRKVSINAVQKRSGGILSDPYNSVSIESRESVGEGVDLKLGSDYNVSKDKSKLNRYVGLERTSEDRVSSADVVYSDENSDISRNSLKLKDRYKLNENFSILSGIEYDTSKNKVSGGSGRGLRHGGKLQYESYKLDSDIKYERYDSRDVNDKLIKRQIVGFGVSYRGYDAVMGDKSYEGNLRANYRTDRGDEEIDQYRIRGSIKGWLNIDSEIFSKLDISSTNDKKDDNKDRKDSRLDIGYSFRPVYSDKVNIISKISYIDNKAGTGVIDDFLKFGKERGIVLSNDLVYEINDKFEYAWKVGYRKSEEQVLNLALAKSTYWLLGNKLSYKYDKDTKLSLGLNSLRHIQADNKRLGVDLSVSRRFNDNIELEAGYKFDDVSDDLADLSYSSKGFYMRLTGGF